MLVPVSLIIVGIGLTVLLGVWVFGERGALMRSSTWTLLREGGFRHFINGDFFHAYVYARWSNQYIGRAIKRTLPRLSLPPEDRGWTDQYHGKVLTQELAKALITVEQDIVRRDMEQVIPYATARDLVLQGLPDVAIYDCPCRSAREEPCQPTQVCMVVGQPFVDFILEHNPRSSRRITTKEAVRILCEEHERGHAHVAYFKDVMLNRFYAICNCCGCCCGGIEAMVKRGVPMVTSSGYVAQINRVDCPTCGACEAICPFGAIHVGDDTVVNRESCMGCGVCVDQCPMEAIRLVRDEHKGVPLDVRLLRSVAHA